MTRVDYFAINREPVSVNIENAHEHRQLYAVAFEIFRFVDLLEGHHRAIGTCDNGVGLVAVEKAFRRPEKIDYQKVENSP
jgi:hypothetical protein